MFTEWINKHYGPETVLGLSSPCSPSPSFSSSSFCYIQLPSQVRWMERSWNKIGKQSMQALEDRDHNWGAHYTVKFPLHGVVQNTLLSRKAKNKKQTKKKNHLCHTWDLMQWINPVCRDLMARWGNFLTGQEFQPFFIKKKCRNSERISEYQGARALPLNWKDVWHSCLLTLNGDLGGWCGCVGLGGMSVKTVPEVLNLSF